MNLEDKENDFTKICRICLKNYQGLLYIFKSEVPNMLKYCSFLMVVEGDGFPDKICQTCSDMLVQSYKLKQLCLHSESYLHSLVEEVNILDISSKSENDTANSNLDCECLQLPEDETSESESVREIAILHKCSECLTCFSSDKLFKEHSCSSSIDENQSILPNTECYSPLVTSTNESDLVCESELDDLQNTTCPQCNSLFHHKQDVLVHQSIHSDKAICNVCKKLFRTMKMLKRHIKIHMITKSHVCEICHKGFSESTALHKHTKLHHLQQPRDKKYACDECGQRFTDKYYLNLHKRKHTGEKPFKCKVCEKSFYDPRSYKVHMDVHKGTKPYLCSHCGKSFVQSAHLKQHLLVHTKEKPYCCNICNKRFTQSNSLHRHQKQQPGLFNCCMCSESFLNEQQLLDHFKNHNNNTNKTVETNS